MAIVFMDGFDYYNASGTTTGLQAKWRLSYPASIVTSSTTPYSVGQSASLNDASYFNPHTWMIADLPAAASTFAIGLALNINTAGGVANTSNTIPIIALGSGSDSAMQCGLSIGSSGQLCITRGTGLTGQTVLASSASNLILATAWNYIELVIKIDSSVGTANIYLNGNPVAVATFSGNTQAQAGSTADRVILQNSARTSSGAILLYDDFYVDTASPAAQVGQRRIETIYPSADTAQKQWTASTGSNNSAMVNSPTMQTTNYVQANTVGYQDLYDLTNLGTSPTSIDAIQVNSLAQKTDVASRAIATSVKSGSTNNDGSDVYLGVSYALNSRILTTDPNTLLPWTASAVNSLQAGVKVTV